MEAFLSLFRRYLLGAWRKRVLTQFSAHFGEAPCACPTLLGGRVVLVFEGKRGSEVEQANGFSEQFACAALRTQHADIVTVVPLIDIRSAVDCAPAHVYVGSSISHKVPVHDCRLVGHSAGPAPVINSNDTYRYDLRKIGA